MIERYTGGKGVCMTLLVVGLFVIGTWVLTRNARPVVQAAGVGAVAGWSDSTSHTEPSRKLTRVVIETEPSGALIFVNGTQMGRSPVRASILLDDDGYALVEARRTDVIVKRRVKVASGVTNARVRLQLSDAAAEK